MERAKETVFRNSIYLGQSKFGYIGSLGDKLTRNCRFFLHWENLTNCSFAELAVSKLSEWWV